MLGLWIGCFLDPSLHPGAEAHCHSSQLSLSLFGGWIPMLMRPCSWILAPWGPINFTLLQLPGASELKPDQLVHPRCLVTSIPSLVLSILCSIFILIVLIYILFNFVISL